MKWKRTLYNIIWRLYYGIHFSYYYVSSPQLVWNILTVGLEGNIYETWQWQTNKHLGCTEGIIKLIFNDNLLWLKQFSWHNNCRAKMC